MIRVFVSEPLLENAVVPCDEKQGHYLSHVMRLKAGEEVAVFNGQDGEWCGTFEPAKKSCAIRIVRLLRAQETEQGDILAAALIKKDNFDLVLQKATELGVKKIIPLISEHTVVRQLNQERAQSILIEAAEQCERLDIPELCMPMTVPEFLQKYTETPIVFLSERGCTTGIVPTGQVCFMVGPEGGWSAKEIAMLESHKNCTALNLGRLILRAETASIGILASHRFSLFNK